MEMFAVEEEHVLPPPPSLTVLVAVNGSKRSDYAVKWALENFSAVGRTLFRLLHVCPSIKAVPTPMGNYMPITQVRADVAAAYKEEMEWKTKRLLLPYKRLHTKRKVELEVVVVEEDDVPQAISREVCVFQIHKLVIGASSRGWFTRKFKGQNLSSRISNCIPSFCAVYVVFEGKVTIHPSASVADGSIKDTSDNSSTSTKTGFSYNSRSQTEIIQFQALPTINENVLLRRSSSSSNYHPRNEFMENGSNAMNLFFNNSDVRHNGSGFSSLRSMRADFWSWNSNQASTSDSSSVSSSSDSRMHANMKANASSANQREKEIDEDDSNKLADGNFYDIHEEEADALNHSRIPTCNKRDSKSGNEILVQPNDPFSISKCTELLFSISNVSKEIYMKALKVIRADPTWREAFMSVPHEIRLEMLSLSQLD